MYLRPSPTLRETFYCPKADYYGYMRKFDILISSISFPEFINLAVVNPVKEVNPSPLTAHVI